MNDKLLEKIKEVLLKKAEGYYYTEEVLEYQIEPEENSKKNTTKPVIQQLTLENFDIQSDYKQGDKNLKKDGKPKRKTKSFQEERLVLSKKKVTTHHIPPDMLAIKMLIEISGEKVEDDLSSLTSEELLKLSNQIIFNLNNLNKGEQNDN